ncbi:MAG: uroporphyrinogen-III synthase, partial [Phycisphaerae bacterium]|nr:uroporphyrinogen-III synthase [Phycisphaerae bacterium]
PEEYVAESLAKSLASLGDLRGKRFLLLRADIARTALNEALATAGAVVVDRAIYQTLPGESLPAELGEAVAAGRVNCVTFTSASTAKNFFALADSATRKALASGTIKAAAIGPIAAAAFAEVAGRPADIVAAEHTIPGLVAAIVDGATSR